MLAKRERRTTVNDCLYFGCAFGEHDKTWFDGIRVAVVSSDQQFCSRCGLHQVDDVVSIRRLRDRAEGVEGN